MALEEPPRQIDPAFFTKLGQIVVESARIEAFLGDLLSIALQADRSGLYVITENVSGGTMTAWLRTLSDTRQEHTPPEISERIYALLKDIDEFRAERNKLVHGQWITDQSGAGTIAVSTVKLERAAIMHTEVYSAADLDGVLLDARDVLRRLIILVRELGISDAPEQA